MSRLQSEKFFNDSEISGIKNSNGELYEKIKLEFSVLHPDEGSYSIQAKLYDDQVLDFTSEIKKSIAKQKIVFEKFFVCDFRFEIQQNLQITLNKNNNPIEINTTLGNIIGSLNGTFIKDFDKDQSLVIKVKKLGKEEDLLNIRINLKNNSDPNFFINNKLYYLITCRNNDIYKSAEISNNGIFAPIQIPTCLLQPSYTISFYNFFNKPIFTYNRTTQDVKAKNKFQIKINFLNDKYLLLEDNSEIIKKFTFLDYLNSGVKIALSIGIDFSISNDLSSNNGTLHSLQGPNDYERAIISCANILGYYDYDQLFPVFGFGAIINDTYSNVPSMCFNLNFTDNPDIYTINNVLKAYRDCIQQNKLTFSGPSQFAPLIRKVISRINQRDIFEYHILLILTDGVIDDLQQTIDILVEASLLPLSVIIVGIGNADFKKMEILDGDEIPLTSSTGKKRMRDLVQFVPFSKYQNNAEKLSMEVLAEIPRQIVEYYQFRNLNPNQIENLIKNGQMMNNYSYQNYYQNSQYINNNTNSNMLNPGYIINSITDNNNNKIYTNPININYQNPNLLNNMNDNPNISSGFKRSYTQGNDIYYQEKQVININNNNTYLNTIYITSSQKSDKTSKSTSNKSSHNSNNSNASKEHQNKNPIDLENISISETINLNDINAKK